MNIQDDTIVEIDFNLTDKDGKVLDTSKGEEPLLYIQGKKQMLPALESVLEGKKTGDKFSTVINATDGYGNYNKDLIMVHPMADFAEAESVEVGMQFFAHNDEGDEAIATVKSIDGDNVTVDLNHPLADVDLHFEVEVVSVREATKDELEHGHVHQHGESCSH